MQASSIGRSGAEKRLIRCFDDEPSTSCYYPIHTLFIHQALLAHYYYPYLSFEYLFLPVMPRRAVSAEQKKENARLRQAKKREAVKNTTHNVESAGPSELPRPPGSTAAIIADNRVENPFPILINPNPVDSGSPADIRKSLTDLIGARRLLPYR